MDDIVDSDSDGVGKRVVELDDDVVGAVALIGTFLQLELQVQRRQCRESHVINLLKGHNRNKTAESLVLGFFAQPLPLSPTIGHSCVARSFVGEVDRPHDTLIEVRSNRLILKHCEVSPIETVVAIHAGTEHTFSLFAADDAIVADDLTRHAHEVSSPISNQVVVETCAEDISAASEPAQLIRAGRISIQIAIIIAVFARRVEEIVTSDHIETTVMRTEGEVAATGRCTASVGLFEVVKDNVFKEGLAVVNRLFADNIEACSEFARHDLTIGRSSVHPNTDIVDATSGRSAVTFDAARPGNRCDVRIREVSSVVGLSFAGSVLEGYSSAIVSHDEVLIDNVGG